MRRYFKEESIVELSVKTEEGLDHLEEAIARLFFGGQLESNDLTYVSNVRHIALLKKAKQSLTDAYEAADSGIPIDICRSTFGSPGSSLAK
ncbi:hypothetical protein HMSSN036_96310 [Paenibacillus macerans]|nr:hypothetical protein HMSSN036_96310 [Paenibacillus macerans]